LIVRDLNGEQFPVLQTRIESGGVSIRCGQIHAGVRERTLRDGIIGRAPEHALRERRKEDILRGTFYEGKTNVTTVPLLAVKLEGA
jgi:hypothetical protein